MIYQAYPNQSYRFSYPTGSRKVIDKMMVDCNWLLASIYRFAWYKISLKLFAQALFCWSLTLYIAFTGSEFTDTESCPRVWLQIFCGAYPNWPYIFLPPKVCGRLWRGYRLCGWNFHYQLIDWIQVNCPKFLLLIVFYIGLISGIRRKININLFINIIGSI